MMRRREFIALMGASVTSPFAALAQEPRRTFHLGCLYVPPRTGPLEGPFFDELRRYGFIEGQNLTVEWRGYARHVDLISQYATELVNARVDVIATAGEEAVRAVQQATKIIPIVHAYRHLIMERAFAAHLPTIYEFPETAEEGGFAGYGPRLSALLEANARQIVRLFHGSKIADIPVEQPTKFELVALMKT
jgi:hypothetical protein